MSFVREFMQWLGGREVVFGVAVAVSVFAFFGTLLLVPWILVRLPADYFSRHREKRVPVKPVKPQHVVIRVVLLIGKNLLGGVLLLVGIAMLVLPGQGLLTILIGLLLIDFPGKYKAQRYLVTRRPVLRSINWLRQRGHREPLQLD